MLAVGVSTYPGDLKLQYAARDAEALAKVCQDKSGALYRKVEVKLLTNERPRAARSCSGSTPGRIRSWRRRGY